MDQRQTRWQTPALLAVIGLTLMIAGWKATSYVATSPREAAQAQELAELREMARQDASTQELSRAIDRVADDHRETVPYRTLGRLAFFAGLFAFVSAGVVMARARPPEEPSGDENDEFDEPEA
jgi:hypothetical protein